MPKIWEMIRKVTCRIIDKWHILVQIDDELQMKKQNMKKKSTIPRTSNTYFICFVTVHKNYSTRWEFAEDQNVCYEENKCSHEWYFFSLYWLEILWFVLLLLNLLYIFRIHSGVITRLVTTNIAWNVKRGKNKNGIKLIMNIVTNHIHYVPWWSLGYKDFFLYYFYYY